VGVVVNRSDEWIKGALPDECFHCGERLMYPVIYWAGEQVIALHPACCNNLCIGLMRDLSEAKNLLEDHARAVEKEWED